MVVGVCLRRDSLQVGGGGAGDADASAQRGGIGASGILHHPSLSIAMEPVVLARGKTLVARTSTSLLCTLAMVAAPASVFPIWRSLATLETNAWLNLEGIDVGKY